jgi:hypothetical protein
VELDRGAPRSALLDEGLRRTIQPRLRASVLVGAFAVLGLLIGTVGLYGTLSADVTRLGRELGVRSPLQEALLTKEDVRQLSKTLGLPTWDKPSFASTAA